LLDLVKAVDEIVKEGAVSRRTGTPNRHAPNTIRSYLHSHGWLCEDLRIALMKANPSYEAGQAAFGQGLEHLTEDAHRKESTMDSLKVSDAAAGAVAVAPRVTLEDIEGAIAERHHLTADQAVRPDSYMLQKHPQLSMLSICILVMKNGFSVIGHSAPASPENFNAELGKKLAYENAIRQLWPLMGFALRDKLHTTATEIAMAERLKGAQA
jgi:hypothetical protein